MDGFRLLPKMEREFILLGERIKLARLRRKYSAQQVAERSGIDTPTLLEIEQGSYNVSMGVYASVLKALGLERDIYRIAEDDVLGRKLQDIELLGKEKDL